MPVGNSKANLLQSESPSGLQMQHNVLISLNDLWLLTQIAVCTLFPRAVVLSGSVGVFPFLRIPCFPQSLSQLADGYLDWTLGRSSVL